MHLLSAIKYSRTNIRIILYKLLQWDSAYFLDSQVIYDFSQLLGRKYLIQKSAAYIKQDIIE